MVKSMKKTVKSVKVEKKVEKPVVSESDIIIMPDSPKKSKLTSEFQIRFDNLAYFVSDHFKTFVDEGKPVSLADCEKILSMAFDCRNSARKLAKVESDIIIA